MKILNFFTFLWKIFALLDSGSTDLIKSGSGSETMAKIFPHAKPDRDLKYYPRYQNTIFLKRIFGVLTS
jgi:hypothetical protein